MPARDNESMFSNDPSNFFKTAKCKSETVANQSETDKDQKVWRASIYFLVYRLPVLYDTSLTEVYRLEPSDYRLTR